MLFLGKRIERAKSKTHKGCRIVWRKNKYQDSALEPREEVFQEGKPWSPVVFITAAMKRCEGLQETLGSNRNSKTQMDFFSQNADGRIK